MGSEISQPDYSPTGQQRPPRDPIWLARSLNTTSIVTSVYITAIAVTEASQFLLNPLLSIWLHAWLVAGLLGHALVAPAAIRRILPSLALLPLLRVVSLAMPLRLIAPIYWYALIGCPLLIAIALTARALQLRVSDLGLRWDTAPKAGAIALSGVPLGLLAFLLMPSGSVATPLDWQAIAIGSVILLVFSAFLEEALFRGLLQSVAREVYGKAGLIVSTLLFTNFYLGSMAPGYILFIGLVGWFFARYRERTGSLYGVTLAHGLMNIESILILPTVSGGIPPEVLALARTLTLVGVGIGVVVGVGWLLKERQSLAEHKGARAAGAGATLPGSDHARPADH